MYYDGTEREKCRKTELDNGNNVATVLTKYENNVTVTVIQ